ncbi:putative hydro-lyase [Catenulispora yoronensis]|uniref:Hydro-lyase n=1 Tax=Catenulispora yoronensis TaxID=450799 RepID=A0ABP5G7L0_9ACTN
MADSPTELRAAFRSGVSGPTSGLAPGYAQANLLVVSTDWAYDVLLFAQRNQAACPVLDVTDPGSPATALAPGADLRTDLPKYRVWRDGDPVGEPTDVTDLWREDLVAFLVGCSFTFDSVLTRAGVPWRYPGRNVAMYVTDRQCRPAGRVHGPLVVSMRPVPEELVDTAVRITTLMPRSHGAPVHIGPAAELGIADLTRPDFGDQAIFEPEDVPVFWACGVTLQAAVMASRPDFAITHAPGHMFITDLREQI